MKWLSDHFSPATLSPIFNQGGLSAEDVVLHMVKRILAADSKLQGIFGDRIRVVDAVNPFDVVNLPALFVTSSLMNEQPVPGLRVGEAHVYIVIRYEDFASTDPLEEGEASIASLVKYIDFVLEQPGNKLLQVTLLGGLVRNLARRSEAGSTRIVHNQPNETTVVVNQVMERKYVINVDPSNGIIYNASVGG
jgi:hypothetical protein